jgi:hypothetical protein
MPDSKITALTSIGTSTDPANDPLVLVDVSDTSMAASGTTKKVTLNQLLATSPSATLASATITGDLTVDTSTLKVDSANNRVGIGTASPSATFDIRRNASGSAFLSYHNGGNGTVTSGADLNEIRCDDTTTSYNLLNLNVLGSARFVVASNGVCTWSNVGGVAGTAMTLNSTGLGVGEAATVSKLQPRGSTSDSSAYILYGKAASGNVICFMRNDGRFLVGNGTSDNFIVTETGNVGVGVTPAGTGGCLQLKSGITFPATQVASSDANTLDDYEEGTFTPAISGTTSAGTGTYTTQFGRYTKVGRVVTCDITITWTAHTGTGNLEIDGLPFSVLTTTNYTASAAIGYFENVALTAGNVPAFQMLWFNTTKLRGYQYPTGGGSVTSIPMDSAGQMSLSITYIVA